MIADPDSLQTEADQRRNPTVRVDYDEAFAIAGAGEGSQATKSKHWGDGPRILPLEPDDPVDPVFILYRYKEHSVYNRRFRQRQRLKQLLGGLSREVAPATASVSRFWYNGDMSTATPNHQAEILARAIRADDADLSADAARSLLALQLPHDDRDRVNQLAAKAREGSLTEEERGELDDYERVASLLELLQSKARLSLKRAGLGS